MQGKEENIIEIIKKNAINDAKKPSPQEFFKDKFKTSKSNNIFILNVVFKLDCACDIISKHYNVIQH